MRIFLWKRALWLVDIIRLSLDQQNGATAAKTTAKYTKSIEPWETRPLIMNVFAMVSYSSKACGRFITMTKRQNCRQHTKSVWVDVYFRFQRGHQGKAENLLEQHVWQHGEWQATKKKQWRERPFGEHTNGLQSSEITFAGKRTFCTIATVEMANYACGIKLLYSYERANFRKIL